MARREFKTSVKIAIVKRATRDGVTYCEACRLPAKRWQIDHIIADAHGGEPTIENAQFLCDSCYAIKNPQDTTIAAKLKRQEARALGIRKPSTLRSRNTFPGPAPKNRTPSDKDRETQATVRGRAMTATPYPLAWPAGRPRRPAGKRKAGKFNTKERRGNNSWVTSCEISVADALSRLQEALDRIDARHPVVSSNLETRLDGLPRSGGRRPDDPAVAVYFQLNGKPVCMPCDTYQLVEHNIAAVAAHIEATRAIERHGVASVAEMFSGFVALPPSHRDWWDVLECRSDASRDVIEAEFRRLAKDFHPDRIGGSHRKMAEINRARDEALKDRG